MYDSHNSPVIGIDLGTTFSAVARWTGEDADVYSPKGERTMQSVVFYDEKTDKFIFGRTAFMSGMLKPENLCIGVKRLMDNKDAKVTLGGKEYSPIDISSMILKSLYSNVKGMFPEGVYDASGAVVTVPYYFKAHQCENTAEAAKKAGLNLVGILQEPIAAAFAYGLHHSSKDTVRNENILVFDLGGGTFDITLFKIVEDRENIKFEVLAIGGDDRLGGLDFDNSFMKYILDKEGIDLDECDNERMKKIGLQKLMDSVTKSKEALSSTDSVFMGVPDVIPGVHIDNEYTREDFEESISNYLEEIKAILKSTLNAANIDPKDIDKVLKVGGSSKIPAMDMIIEEVVGRGKTYSDIDPSLCVAQGAAIYGAYLTNNLAIDKKITIETTTAHALGVEDSNGSMVVLIHQNQKTPARKTLTFTTDEDNSTEIDVEVYQGASRIAKQNAHIGTVKIKGLVPKPKYELQIKITFEVGKEQMVKVTVEQEESNIKHTEMLKLA
ncbi:Hsp70 family protein [Clostridium bovifaecis]|uniref:Chaperone protein DnaK n=1 Tax=Clostridium bovifaecis TaxID=2184719 RepID=A0A6I6EQG7_9CLOT|nr:Hsp70 family protein [Clostridium bovifaecis]